MSLASFLPPPGADPLDVVSAFMAWAESTGRPLYPHQEDALMALADDTHVVLATPTGSGKSLAALAGIALARNRGERAVWTAPIKALVAEKFFDLAALLGAEQVGLATGDASINPDAPILVCTAEVYANQTLAEGDRSPATGGTGFACLDEFHYYGEADRGWAWQVPLLTAHRTQFLLMSATLGDMTAISADLELRSKRQVTNVTAVTRPTPLYHQYRMTNVADTITEAVKDGLSPVYVVHATQAAAGERANALTSLPLTTRPQREAIAAALAEVRFAKGYGQTLQRVLRNGVGIHHAGMLPRYRRLVERLAGEGLLPVICGTDTLGVGVNIPIRTVLLTALTKFDGKRVRTFSAREFHQLAGRAGRAGFDPDGHVWAQAPDHIIENAKALSRAGDDPKARRKATKAQPPKNFVHYDDKTFERLIAASPEPLISRFKVTPDLLATVLGRPDGPAALKELLATNHDPEPKRRAHKKRAIAVYRSLEAAGVAARQRDEHGRCLGVSVGSLIEGSDERSVLRFASPLMPFAIEVIATLDREDPSYHLDVVSIVEAVLDDPNPILFAQRDEARGTEIAQMKRDGVEYEERMARLEHITWPQPQAELLAACYATYRAQHPWIEQWPSPKSILREVLESGETFGGFIQRFQLQRSEGLFLRYLTDAWRTLDRSLPDDAYTETLEDVIEWLGALIRATDASLLDEWERLAGRPEHDHPDRVDPGTFGPPKAWRTAVRAAAFRWVELVSQKRYDLLANNTGWEEWRLRNAFAGFWSEFDRVETDGDARSTRWFALTESPTTWTLTQQVPDPEGAGEWRLVAEIDLAEAKADGAPTLRLVKAGRFGEELEPA